MNRAERHAAIQRLIHERPISTQIELADALRDAGHDVVQTTVSRDIHELGLQKVRHESGRLVYAFPEESGYSEDLTEALARWALTIEPSGNLVVITTPYGYSERACAGHRRRAPSAHRGHDRRREHDAARLARAGDRR